MKAPVLVLGCGSIGRRHMANLKSLGRRVVACDPDAQRRAWVEKELGVETVASVARGLALRPAAVWVCTPPSAHAATAVPALKARRPTFVEKPLAHDLASGRALVRAAGRTRAAVGYQMRLHPALRWIKARLDSGAWGRLLFLRAEFGQYLPDWRPWQDFRRSYTARKSLGGGILLDASHELDIVRWLGGEARSVSCLARTLAFPLDVEDTAALLVELRSGALAEVHIDMVQRGFRRGVLLACEKATIEFTLPASRVTVTKGRGRAVSKNFPFVPNDLYLDEAKAFLGGSTEVVTPADALRTLELVEAARRSSRTGRRISL